MSLPNPFPRQNTIKIHDSSDPKMVKCGSKGIWAVLVLDESTSMAPSRADTISGVNTYLRNVEDGTVLSLVKFNTSVIDLAWKVDAHKFQLSESNYMPSGGTALADAIGYAMDKVNAQLKALREEDRPTVVFCIVTDGEENSSRRFTTESIKNLISQAQESLWGFTFLGADIDAFQAGGGFGIAAGSIASFDKSKITETFRSASAYTRSYGTVVNQVTTLGLTGQAATDMLGSVAYSDSERASMKGDK